MPSIAPTQTLPAHARTTHGSAVPSQGVPDGFGDALAQALTMPELAGSAGPAIPALTDTAFPPAQALSALPTAAAAPQADPAMIDPSKPEKDGLAASPTEDEDEPSGEAAEPSEASQALTPFQPILPAAPQGALPQAAPVIAQPAAPPPDAGDAAPSTEQDATAPVASIEEGRQPPSAAAPAAPQTAAPPASVPPSQAAAAPAAGDTAVHAAQKHSVSVTAEKEPSAALPAPSAEAAPLLPTASAPLPTMQAPLSIAPHPAPAPPQSPTRSPAADRPAPPPAAVQVGPVLASFAAGAAQPGAPQHLTIRLDPTDLGRVQVRIERLPDGSARVNLKVEKPDTLLLLLRDQPQLHRTLDLAGVPSTERTLQFHLAPPDAPAPGGMAAQSNADGGHGQHRPGQPHSGRFAAHGSAPSSGEPTPGPATFRRAGVDITA